MKNSTKVNENCNIFPQPLKRNELKKKIQNFIEAQGQITYYKRLLAIFGFPGIGKTFLLKEIAQKYGKNVKYINSPDIIDNSKCQKIIDLFSQLRQIKNSILIIDSLQSIANIQSYGWKVQQTFLEKLINETLDTKSTLKIILITQTISKLDLRLQDILKREDILILSLPDQNQRYNILKTTCEESKIQRNFLQQDLRIIAYKSEGFTISDILIIIRHAQYSPIRKLMIAKKFKKLQNGKYTVAEPGEDGQEMSINQVSHNFDLTVTRKDLMDSFQKWSSTVSSQMVNKENQYLQKWNNMKKQ